MDRSLKQLKDMTHKVPRSRPSPKIAQIKKTVSRHGSRRTKSSSHLLRRPSLKPNLRRWAFKMLRKSRSSLLIQGALALIHKCYYLVLKPWTRRLYHRVKTTLCTSFRSPRGSSDSSKGSNAATKWPRQGMSVGRSSPH